MQYFGGKSKIAKNIAIIINDLIKEDQPYWEPFVGGGSILYKVDSDKKYASDLNQSLIFMYQKVQKGWIPPESVTEEEYIKAKNGLYDAALTSFIAIGCSFGGAWFNGYARTKKGINNPYRYAKQARNDLVYNIEEIRRIHFFVADFLDCYVPDYNCLIYCDPPYSKVSGYDAVGYFDNEKFWEKVRHLEFLGHTVLVSEYEAPSDFSCIETFEVVSGMDLSNKKEENIRIEKLFRLGNYQLIHERLF